MVGRKPKYSCPRTISGYADDKDILYCDDHKGEKIGRMEFLIECMYATKGNHEQIRKTSEEISKLKAENHELKKQLMFEQTKNKKYTITSNNNDLEQQRIKIYEQNNITAQINARGYDIGYDTLAGRYPTLFETTKIARDWIIQHYRNNGGATRI